MTKRRRLDPARLDPSGADWFGGDATGAAPPPTSGDAPIARIAGQSAQAAALAELADEMAAARNQGRVVLALPRAAIVADHLIRDRVAVDAEALAALTASIRARGQQAPIEVVALESETETPRYGLISGWRRLLALADLAEQTGDPAYDTVLALIRQPADRAAAYVAMVEENEIRAALSFYERARLVVRALQAGVFADEKQALHGLFVNVSYAKRSKIKTFMPLVTAFDSALRFPAQIPERTGLALSRALETRPGFAADLIARLAQAAPQDAAAEAAVLAAALRDKPGKTGSDKEKKAPVVTLPDPYLPGPYLIAPGVQFSGARGKVVIEGEGVNPGFLERLTTWLQQGQS